MLSVEEDLGPGLHNGDYFLFDRGDAPAQEVLDRNARSLAQRMADETREELSKVMKRVDNVSQITPSCIIFEIIFRF